VHCSIRRRGALRRARMKREGVQSGVLVVDGNLEVQFKDRTQGLSVLDQLRTFNVDLKAVFISGYPDDAATMQQTGHAYLCKPFREREFLAIMRDLMWSRHERGS
jgi:FixJ family two-component response regulator